MQETIALIYETIAAPGTWDSVLQRMSDQLGASASALFFRPSPDSPAPIAQTNLMPAAMAEYITHFHAEDVLLDVTIEREAELAGRALRVRDLVDERRFHGSEFFNDFLQRNAISDALCSVMLDPAEPPGRSPLLRFYRPPDAPQFSGAEARRMQACLPHIQRALRLRAAIVRQVQTAPIWAESLIEQLPAGVFVLDGRRRVVHANRAARAIVDAHDGLCLREGTLRAPMSGTARALDAAVAASLSALPIGTDLRIPRPGPGAEWLLSVCPLSREGANRAWGDTAARAWVYVADPVANSEGLPRRLGALFGLTPAECRVASALLAGLSLGDIAEAHRVSVTTVRTQVQAVFARLGVRRQAELASLLRGIVGLPGGN